MWKITGDIFLFKGKTSTIDFSDKKKIELSFRYMYRTIMMIHVMLSTSDYF